MLARPPATAIRTTVGIKPERRAQLFRFMVGLLPLHTVALHWWISWKPWLLLLGVVLVWQATEGIRDRTWPWHPAVSAAAAGFLIAALASWSGDAPERFLRLFLALAAGAGLLLATARELRSAGAVDATLRVAFRSAAALAVSALLVSLLAAGTFGEQAISRANDLPGVERLTKVAYQSEGFVAITNWHEDPGYAAAWMNLWALLALVASRRGLGFKRPLLDGAVIGGLWLGVILTLSRTGLLGMVATVLAFAWRERRTIGEATRLLLVAAAATLVLLAVVWALDPEGVGNDLTAAIGFRFTQGLSLGPGEGDLGGAGGEIDYRGVVWPRYVEAFRENPLRGIGLGAGWASGMQEPHNLVLELLGEMGIVGFTCFAVLMITVLRNASNPLGRTALVVALSAAVTQTVLFEATWWFAAGLALAPDPQVRRGVIDTGLDGKVS
jgi:O-antigen ligase